MIFGKMPERWYIKTTRPGAAAKGEPSTVESVTLYNSELEMSKAWAVLRGDLTQALRFAAKHNYLHAIDEAGLEYVEGQPKAIAWDSWGEIETLKFNDGSTYRANGDPTCA